MKNTSGQFINILKRTNKLQIYTYAIKENSNHTSLVSTNVYLTALKIRDVATSRPSVGLHVVSIEIRSHVFRSIS